MKADEVKLRRKVFDRWYPERGTGRVVQVLKTRAKIRWPDGTVQTYDHAHFQFLERA